MLKEQQCDCDYMVLRAYEKPKKTQKHSSNSIAQGAN